MNVVISQSMLFPWVGMLEQIRLADVYIFYDDVQFSKGGFTNRVQIKTPQGSRWLTVPLDALKLGQSIEEVAIKEKAAWVERHLEFLRQSLKGAPFFDDAMDVVQTVYEGGYSNIGSLARESVLSVARYYGLLDKTRLVDVKDLGVPGSGSERVLAIVKAVAGNSYITGHGAKHYLDHDLFEGANITVKYMDYRKVEYPQLHGEFTPYVSSLDLIANCGPSGKQYICSEAVDWRQFLQDQSEGA